MTEFELKLAGPPGLLRRLPVSDLIAPLIVGPKKLRLLTTAYFDTPDHLLKTARIAWRVRKNAKGYLQSVKYRPAAGAGLLSEAFELERAGIDGMFDPTLPDDPRLDDQPDLRAILAQAAARPDFSRRFETHVRRRAMNLGMPDGSVVEMAIDIGSIHAGRKQTPISEVEFELMNGSVDAVYDIAGATIDRFGLTLELETKAARGFALSDGPAPRSRKSEAATLDPSSSVNQVLAAALSDIVGRAARHSTEFRKTPDVEGVHQMRVALRRMRAAVGLFGDVLPEATVRQLKPRLKTPADQLGPCRDLDVFLDDLIPTVRADMGESTKALDPLMAQGERMRPVLRRSVRAALEDRAFSRLLLDLDRLRHHAGQGLPAAGRQPAAAYAKQVLDHRLKRVTKLGRQLDDVDDAVRHSFRIEIKKLRYGCMFFQSLFPSRLTGPYLTVLADLQDALGSLNDAATARVVIDRLIAGAGVKARPAVAYAGGLVLGQAQARAVRKRRLIVGQWAALKKLKPFWRGPDKRTQE